MQLTNLGLRKAAILVSNLDTAAADAVLDQLTPEQAQEVRRLVVEMETIDGNEQQRVIDEFVRVGPMVPSKCPPGIELDGRLAWLGAGGSAPDEPPAERPSASANDRPTSRPFQSLRDAETDKLVRVLADERPQTIAVVLSHLGPQRAAAVLARLSADLQTEVIHRLVDLEEADPEILREVESALQTRLSEQVQMQRRRVAGIQAITGILDAADDGTGMQILDNLAVRDHVLAERLGPKPVEFDDLEDLDDDTLVTIFDAAGRDLMVPALLGATPAMVRRVLAQLPTVQAEAIRKQLLSPGPIRLRDVEEARHQVARLARRWMARAGRPADAAQSAAGAASEDYGTAEAWPGKAHAPARTRPRVAARPKLVAHPSLYDSQLE